MGYISFHEYVEKNKKPQKTKTALVADYDGPRKDAPELGKKPENAGGTAQGGKVPPYKGGKDAADPNKGKLMDGLGGKLDHSKSGEVGKPTKDLGNYPLKTQEWIDKTKGLSLAEFTRKIRESRLAGVQSPSKTYESIKETVAVCKGNRSYVKDVVLEMKRQGVFETFFAAMASHPESFNVIAKLMESDGYARKLVMAIDEMVGPPVGDDEMDMPAPKMKHKHKHKMKGKMHDMGDEDMGDEDMGDEDMGDEDMGDEEGEDLGDEDGMGGEDMGGEDMGDMLDKPKLSGKDKLMKAMKMMGHM
jgi:hypothetical protein